MGARADAISLSEYTWNRLRRRLDGLTDHEYFWSPVPGAWTVRRLRNGRAVADGAFGGVPEPAPFTTLAWRITHLIDVYGSDRNQRWLGLATSHVPVNLGSWRAADSASGALALLEDAATYWHLLLDAATDEALTRPIGPLGGSYAEASRFAFVLHQLDEAIHHGAEVGVLRDLYARRENFGATKDLDVAREEALSAAYPVARAADLGRWDLVEELVVHGYDVRAPERSALHQAAAVGDLEIVRLLIDHGADPEALDSEWNGNAMAWARAFGSTAVVEYLENIQRAR